MSVLGTDNIVLWSKLGAQFAEEADQEDAAAVMRGLHEEETNISIDDGVEVCGVVAGDSGVVAELGLLLGHEDDVPDPHEQVEHVEDVVEELGIRKCCERRPKEGVGAYR